MPTFVETGDYANSISDEDGNRVFTVVNEDGDVVFGVSTTNRESRVLWAEFEVPSPPSSDRGAEVIWAVLETGDLPRMAHVLWAELEVPDNNRALYVTFADMRVPRRRKVMGGSYRTLKREPAVFFPVEFPRSS